MAPVVLQSPNTTTAAVSSPPPTSAVSPIINLALRILTLVCLLISVILLTTNTVWVTVLVANTFTSTADYVNVKVKFNDFYAYRYLLATTVIGLAYTLLQTAFAIFLISTGNRLAGDGMLLFDFYADKVIAFALATGAAASFGMTQDLKNFITVTNDKFVNKANAAASLCLIGFLFVAVSSVFSSFSLHNKRVN